MWNRGKASHWGLDVIEDCSHAYMVESLTTIHPPSVHHNVALCLVPQAQASDAKDRSRTVFADPFTHISTSEAV